MMERILAKQEEMHAQLELIIRAFPHIDGQPDIEGHRRAHEAMIKAAQAQERFWDELKQEIIKKGVFALLIIALGLLATGLSVKLGLLLHDK